MGIWMALAVMVAMVIYTLTRKMPLRAWYLLWRVRRKLLKGAEGAGGVGMTKDHQVIRAAFSVYGIVAAEIRALIDKEPQA